MRAPLRSCQGCLPLPPGGHGIAFGPLEHDVGNMDTPHVAGRLFEQLPYRRLRILKRQGLDGFPIDITIPAARPGLCRFSAHPSIHQQTDYKVRPSFEGQPRHSVVEGPRGASAALPSAALTLWSFAGLAGAMPRLRKKDPGRLCRPTQYPVGNCHQGNHQQPHSAPDHTPEEKEAAYHLDWVERLSWYPFINKSRRGPGGFCKKTRAARTGFLAMRS